MQAKVLGLFLSERAYEHKETKQMVNTVQVLVDDDKVSVNTEEPTGFVKFDSVVVIGDLRRYEREWYVKNAVVKLADERDKMELDKWEVPSPEPETSDRVKGVPSKKAA